MEDYEFLRDNLHGLQEYWRSWTTCRPTTTSPAIKAIRFTTRISSASRPRMIDIGSEKVESGRYINESDYQHEAMVCFIGHDLVDEFFPQRRSRWARKSSSTIFPFGWSAWRRRSAALSGRARTTSSSFRSRPIAIFCSRPAPRRHQCPGLGRASRCWCLEDEARALMRARRHVPYREDDNFRHQRLRIPSWTSGTSSRAPSSR